jgi:hypothetical protein
MIQLKFEHYINERLGIREDVIILSDFLYEYLKNNKREDIIIEKKDIPKLGFDINKIYIKFKKLKYIATFDTRRTTLTKNGLNIYLIFNVDVDITVDTIYHEVAHLVEYDIKISKRIYNFIDKKFSYEVSNIINNNKFNNLITFIYFSDESEIVSFTHQLYSELMELSKTLNNFYDKKELFEYVIDKSEFKEIYNNMINYNIFDDLKDISEKDKVRFFNDVINLDKKMIKFKYRKINRLYVVYNIISYILNRNQQDIDLETIMYKTQKHINKQGVKLKNKISKLYDFL